MEYGNVKIHLGKMQKVPLREAWKNESEDFTPWLAHEENIILLGEVLGLELEVQKQEVDVGAYRADILCKDTETGKYVVIENQLEDTDHSHLGQLLTYAAGLDSPIIVWIAQSFTEEHRATLDWLNENAGGKLSFFGIEMELWRIGDSAPAPKFNVVSKPNDPAILLKTAVGEAGLTPTGKLRLQYWQALIDYAKKQGCPLDFKEPTTDSWLTYASPVRGYRTGLEVTFRDKYVDVYLGTRSAAKLDSVREVFAKNKADIERELGMDVGVTDDGESGRVWLWSSLDCDPSKQARLGEATPVVDREGYESSLACSTVLSVGSPMGATFRKGNAMRKRTGQRNS